MALSNSYGVAKICLGLLFASLCLGAAHADEGDFIQWHTTNIQLLRGWDYEVGSQERDIVTFEHANGWKYGDFFTFTDYTWPKQGESAYYSEFTPRLSFSKISGYDFSYGIIKDVLLSTTIEKPEHQAPRYLHGLAVDLDIPGFKFFKMDWQVRNHLRLSGVTYQLTLAWNRPFEIGETKWLAEGFADLAGREGTAASHQMIVPRFLLDVGDVIGHEQGQFFAGVEWQYWHNKFGIKGKTESVPQLQLKWVF